MRSFWRLGEPSRSLGSSSSKSPAQKLCLLAKEAGSTACSALGGTQPQEEHIRGSRRQGWIHLIGRCLLVGHMQSTGHTLPTPGLVIWKVCKSNIQDGEIFGYIKSVSYGEKGRSQRMAVTGYQIIQERSKCEQLDGRTVQLLSILDNAKLPLLHYRHKFTRVSSEISREFQSNILRHNN